MIHELSLYPDLYNGRRVAVVVNGIEINATFLGFERNEGVVAVVEPDDHLEQFLIHPEDVMYG